MSAFFVLVSLLAGGTAARAAELPAASKPAETPSEEGKGFDIPGSGLHVTYGGFIEGAVIATAPKNAAGLAPARRRKPTP